MVGGHDHWSSSSSCTLLSLSTIHFFAVVTGPVCERVLKDGQGENWCSVCSRCWSVFPRSASSFHPVLSVPGSCTHPSVISAAVGVLQKFKTRQEVAFRQMTPQQQERQWPPRHRRRGLRRRRGPGTEDLRRGPFYPPLQSLTPGPSG